MTLKRFLIHLLGMALFVVIILGCILLWLNIYTNHGQKLKLPDYIGKPYEEATKDASKRSFQLIVKDSIHKVGQPGGLILSQNPNSGAFVKENRKIYVDITKYTADEVALENLSKMYGRQYTSKCKELGVMDINCKIKGYRHDTGEPDHILEVWYQGKMIIGASGIKSGIKIQKGGELEFVLSSSEGGTVQIPDLICKPYNQVNFMLDYNKIRLGSIEQLGAITDRDKAFVVKQEPAYELGKMINTGDLISLTIQQTLPESCK